MTVSEAIAVAVQFHQAGRLAEADDIYRQVLAGDPQNASAWHLRGVVASQLGNNPAAIQCIQRAIELLPAYAEAHNNLGVVLEKERDWTRRRRAFAVPSN